MSSWHLLPVSAWVLPGFFLPQSKNMHVTPGTSHPLITQPHCVKLPLTIILAHSTNLLLIHMHTSLDCRTNLQSASAGTARENACKLPTQTQAEGLDQQPLCCEATGTTTAPWCGSFIDNLLRQQQGYIGGLHLHCIYLTSTRSTN